MHAENGAACFRLQPHAPHATAISVNNNAIKMHHFEPLNGIHILNTKKIIFVFRLFFRRPFRYTDIADKKTFFRIFLKNVAASKIMKQWFQKFYGQVSQVLL